MVKTIGVSNFHISTEPVPFLINFRKNVYLILGMKKQRNSTGLFNLRIKVFLFGLLFAQSNTGMSQASIYKGTSSYTSDILFPIKGDLTMEEFVAVWWVVNYSY
jgi:hypothetical protein